MARKISGAEADYVRKYKALAGDTSKECGFLTVRKGLFNKYQCRLCGEIIPFKDANTIDKLTGYCLDCMAKLREKEAQHTAAVEEVQELEEKASKPREMIETRVKGISYRENVVKNLLDEDSDYSMTSREIREAGLEDERIYKYIATVCDAKLIKEPENKEDPNAVAVYVYDEKIGYIGRGLAKKVGQLIDQDKVELVEATIQGGPYKILTDDGIEKGEINFGCELTIYIKDENRPKTAEIPQDNHMGR